jgi:hypothetical protein
MSAEMGFVNYIVNMPEAEQASLLNSMWPARVLADAMQLNGAKVRGGDVQHALARLGLRLVSVDEPDPERTRPAAEARYAAVTESAPCDCGFEWVRLRDADDSGSGWWHHGEEDDENGFYRKCRAGNRAPRQG